MRASTLGHFCKLNRADQHLQSLEKQLIDFLRPGTYEIINESHPKGEITLPSSAPTRHIFTRKVIFKREPPLLRWGTIIGDAIHNLRSALDHIIYTISYRSNPAEFADDKTTCFPICDSTAAFYGPHRRNWRRLHEIRGIPPDAQAIIEGLQPYNRRDGGLQHDPLWLLREMDDIDKHRTIHVTGWSAHIIELDVTGISPGTKIHSMWVRPAGVIESGATLAEIEYTAPPVEFPTAAMYMQKEFWFSIAFGEDTPLAGQQVQFALYDLAIYVEGILNSLHRFVPRK